MIIDATIINSLLSAAFVTLLMFLDLYEKEEITKVAKVFLISIILTSIFVFLVHLLVDYKNYSYFVSAVFLAPVFEESFKFGLLFYLMKKWKNEINESFDVIVYLGVIALGFSLFENITYYLNYTHESVFLGNLTNNFSNYRKDLYSIFLARLIPVHLLIDTAAVIFLGYSFKKGNFRIRFATSFFFAVLLHSLWNFTAALNSIIFIVYAILLISMSIFSVVKLLKISSFRFNPPGDMIGKSKKEHYDWAYYVLAYIFFAIVGVSGILISSFLELFY